jgi:hypothetical protein
MRDVSGDFSLTGDTIRMRDLTGSIEGIRYHMEGRVQGFGPDAPFTLDARTEPFTVPNEPPYLVAMPAVVQEQYGNFHPRGRFRAEVHLERARPGGPIEREGLVEVLGASLRFHKFAYPVQGLRGKLHFNNDRVLVNLRGRGPGGGQLSVHGLRIAPPRDGGGSNMTLVARDVPIDATLLSAMEPAHRKAMNLFFSREGRQQLIDRGAIDPGDPPHAKDNTSSPANSAQTTPATRPTDRPVLTGFDLGGQLPYVRVQLHRPVGPDKDRDAVTTVYTRGLRGVFDHWPYPMTSTGGRLIIREGRVTVDQLELRGPTGARATIDGYVETPDERGRGEIVPHLKIKNVRMPIDRLLKASLPAPQNDWLERLHIGGTITGDGRIFRNDQGEIDFKLTASLDDSRARPFHAAYGLENVDATMTLTRDGAELTELTARHGQAELNLTGAVDWSGEGVGFTVDGSARQMQWTPALIELLPPKHAIRQKLSELHKDWQPSARFDAKWTLQRPAGADETDYHVTVRPKSLGFTYQDHAFRFTEMSGAVQLRPGKVELDRLGGAYASGRLQASGLVALGANETALSFTASGEEIGPDLRAALPEAAIQAMERFDFDAGFEVTAGRVTLSDGGAFELETELNLSDATATLGTTLKHINGAVTLNAQRGPDQRWPRIAMTLRADSLSLWQRQLGPVRLKLASSEREPALVRIESLRGSLYGGRLVGSGIFHADSGAYRGSVSLHDVGLAGLLPSDRTDQKKSDPASKGPRPRQRSNRPARLKPAALARDNTPAQGPSGQLTARFTIADDGDPDTPRRGRGALQIRSARLYRQPVVLALLQTINLQLPMSRAFDRVSSRFLLRGSTLRCNLIRIEAPTVAITGRGTMTLPERKLNLTLFTRNPARLDLGPFSEAINVFKDELMCLRVTGTADQPSVRHVSFQGLRKTWEAVMQGQKLPSRPNEPRPMPFRP